jgi:TPR repeat protein
MRWFLSSAEQGVLESQTAAAEMYSQGRGGPQDFAKALKWARKAAARGFPAAQSLIGTMYALGQGVPQDYEEAVSWTRSAAEQGEPGAQFHLGLAYHQGTGVESDPVQAYKWYSLAAALGVEDATYNREILSGEMTADQISEGQRLASEWRAKIVTHAETGKTSADQDQTGASGFEQGDYATDFKENLELAKKGNPVAQANVAASYRLGLGVEQNIGEALSWYRKSAEQGDAEAQHSLGWMYIHGEGVPQDESMAFDLWHKAADQNLPYAQYNLGLMYLGKWKIAEDLVQAYLWFDLAANSYKSRTNEGLDFSKQGGEAIDMRDEVSSIMTRRQRKEAQELIRKWLESHPQ